MSNGTSNRADWPSVEVAVRTELKSFDYYYDEILAEVKHLEPLWVV